MSFIRLAVQNDYETDIVKEGTYDLKCSLANLKDSKGSNRQMVALTLLIISVDQPEKVTPIFENLVLPGPDDEPGSPQYTMSMQRIVRAIAAFKVPSTEEGFNYEDFIEREAHGVLVKQEEILRNDKPSGEYRNVVVWPKVKGERD